MGSLKNTARGATAVVIFALAAAMASGCAGKSIATIPLPASAEPSAEIEKTEKQLQLGRAEQVEKLAPESYENAVRALDDAKGRRARANSNSDILEKVAEANAWLARANEKAGVSRSVLTEALSARSAAVTSESEKAFPKEFGSAEAQLTELGRSIEEGDTVRAEKERDKLKSRYQALELKGVRHNYAGKAIELLQTAKNEGAEEWAPKTLDRTAQSIAELDALIYSNKNSPFLKRMSEETTREAQNLLNVTREAKQLETKRSETVVMELNELRKSNTALGGEKAAKEQAIESQQKKLAELEVEKEMNERFKRARAQFSDEEADVFRENGTLVIRLKGLHFASGKADVVSRDFELLTKVENSLKEFSGSNVRVQGHADALGSKQKNEKLSELRAKAVRDYLVANGAVPETQVVYEGRGVSAPIASNQSAEGRAMNRRVDIIVEASLPG